MYFKTWIRCALTSQLNTMEKIVNGMCCLGSDLHCVQCVCCENRFMHIRVNMIGQQFRLHEKEIKQKTLSRGEPSSDKSYHNVFIETYFDFSFDFNAIVSINFRNFNKQHALWCFRHSCGLYSWRGIVHMIWVTPTQNIMHMNFERVSQIHCDWQLYAKVRFDRMCMTFN